MDSWMSPDGKIEKQVLLPGEWGTKPFDNSECTINILDCPQVLVEYNNIKLVVGDIDGDIGRALDVVLCTMHLKERSKFTLLDLNVTFVCELVAFKFSGFTYEWDSKYKYDLALHHKEKGVKFFKEHNHKEAAYRFIRALKSVLSILVDVEYPPDNIDGIPLIDIRTLKGTLYNNLSSCYFRKRLYPHVIESCSKALLYDPNNVKALYKIGIAYEADKNYEKSYEAFSRALELDPANKACAEHLVTVKTKLKELKVRSNDLMKKMISGTIKK